MGNNGNVCGAWCGWCGACSGLAQGNAVCPACGLEYWRGKDDVGNLCDRCVHNARARAERAIESRQKPKPKPEKKRQCVGLTPNEVVR